MTKNGEYIFNDCSAASPTGREVFFYDHEARIEKKIQTNHNLFDMATDVGTEILTEQ
jgi:hypothetical protein